jgi:hypothetical protein
MSAIDNLFSINVVVRGLPVIREQCISSAGERTSALSWLSLANSTPATVPSMCATARDTVLVPRETHTNRQRQAVVCAFLAVEADVDIGAYIPDAELGVAS